MGIKLVCDYCGTELGENDDYLNKGSMLTAYSNKWAVDIYLNVGSKGSLVCSQCVKQEFFHEDVIVE